MASVLTNIFCNINSMSVMSPMSTEINFTVVELKSIRKLISLIIKDVVSNFKNGHFVSTPDSDIIVCMRKTILEIYNTYKETLLKNASQLLNEVNEDLTIEKAYSDVVESILDDRENFHWSRLCMIFTMLAVLVDDQRSKRQELSWEQYNHILLKMFRCRKIDVWINDHGGWDGFMKHLDYMKQTNKVEGAIWLGTLGLWSLTAVSWMVRS